MIGGRAPIDLDMDAVFTAAELTGTALEVNGALPRLDLSVEHLRREILRAIIEKFEGGPVGLSTLAVVVSEEEDTLEDVYEPYLLQKGFIKRTPRGRVATNLAFEHLGIERKNTRDPGLF